MGVGGRAISTIQVSGLTPREQIGRK